MGLLDADAEVLAESDLIVSRSCGTTLAELALVGAAAIVIPFPEAVDDHQMVNARIFGEAGACRVVDEGSSGNRLDVELSGQLGIYWPTTGRAARCRPPCFNLLGLARPPTSLISSPTWPKGEPPRPHELIGFQLTVGSCLIQLRNSLAAIPPWLGGR